MNTKCETISPNEHAATLAMRKEFNNPRNGFFYNPPTGWMCGPHLYGHTHFTPLGREPNHVVPELGATKAFCEKNNLSTRTCKNSNPTLPDYFGILSPSICNTARP